MVFYLVSLKLIDIYERLFRDNASNRHATFGLDLLELKIVVLKLKRENYIKTNARLTVS